MKAGYDWTPEEVLEVLGAEAEFSSYRALEIYEALIYNWYELGDHHVIKFAPRLLACITVEKTYRALHLAFVMANGFEQLREIGFKKLASIDKEEFDEYSEFWSLLFEELSKKTDESEREFLQQIENFRARW